MNPCRCYFCTNDLEHKHSIPIQWREISSHMLVAESLDPNDMIRLEACHLCGHKREKK